MRLTKKRENENWYVCFNEDKDLFANAFETNQKLGQLEDIEDKLGIDLITLFKALKQEYVWVREHNTESKELTTEVIRLNYPNQTLDFVYPRKAIGKGRNIIGYGKTWALTKEELL